MKHYAHIQQFILYSVMHLMFEFYKLLLSGDYRLMMNFENEAHIVDVQAKHVALWAINKKLYIH